MNPALMLLMVVSSPPNANHAVALRTSIDRDVVLPADLAVELHF